MNRIVLCLTVALVALGPALAYADDPPPTAEQLEAAKKAFAEGKQLHDLGKLNEAIEKFKESYRLSKNPLLLYNIGFTMDEAGQKDLALFYYRKFLSDAPQTASQRGTVSDRVKVLEKDKLEADLNGKPTETKVETKTETTPTAPTEQKKNIKIKPPGTYGANDFQHQVVEDAPPGKPLDITAFVPEDSGFTVTLYYRGSGDPKFNAKVMKWRYKELVGRVPAAKMAGSSIQYYIEAKDQGGNVIAKSGKSTSPNLVNIDAGATPRFYPDITDEGDAVPAAVTKQRDESEDPLGHGGGKVSDKSDTPTHVDHADVSGQGFTDVGSQKFVYAKWGTTGTAGVLLALSMVMAIEAGKQASALADDSKMCPMGGMPPCRPFDSYDQGLQDAGKRDQSISNTCLVFGVLTAGVAGYFWYRELSTKKNSELKVTTKKTSPETTWVVVPAVGEGFGGAAAAARF